MSKNKKINVEGKEVTIIIDNDKEYLSLTDMLKAKDGDSLSRIGFVAEIRLSI